MNEVNVLKKILLLFKTSRGKSSPLVIIRKESDSSKIKDYESIEAAITDLEKDPNVPAGKIEKLKSSLENLKNKSSIRIKNGEIIE
jgi:hypothetical protein